MDDLTVCNMKEQKMIYDLLLEFKDFLFNQTIDNRTLECLSRKYASNAEFLAIKEKNHNVGFCSFYANDIVNKEAFISMIVVKKKAQGKGIGSRLLNLVKSKAKDLGMITLLLEVSKQNEVAINFYLKNGFMIKCEIEDSLYLLLNL